MYQDTEKDTNEVTFQKERLGALIECQYKNSIYRYGLEGRIPFVTNITYKSCGLLL
jgi:hypothetical protein